MSWQRKPPRVKEYTGTKPDAPRTPAPSRGTLSALLMPVDVRPPKASRPPRDPAASWGRAITRAAKGEPCTVRLPGVCLTDGEYSIWSHARWGARLGEAGRGMGTKAMDLCGAIACTACDAVYDGQRPAPHLTRAEIDMDWMIGDLRSLGVLERKGLLP